MAIPSVGSSGSVSPSSASSPSRSPRGMTTSAWRMRPGRVRPGSTGGAKAALDEMDAAVSDLDKWRQRREMELLAARVALERAEAAGEDEMDAVAEANEAVRDAELALEEIESEIAAAVAETDHTIEGIDRRAAGTRAGAAAGATNPVPNLTNAQVRLLREAGSMNFESDKGPGGASAEGVGAAGAAAAAALVPLSATQSEDALAKALADIKLCSGAGDGGDDLLEEEDALFAAVDALIEGYRRDDDDSHAGASEGAPRARADSNGLDVWTARLDSCISIMQDDKTSVGMALAREGKAASAGGDGAAATPGAHAATAAAAS